MEENGALQALLACPPEPEEVAWIRLFAAATHISPEWAWKKLFERALADLMDLNPVPIIASLALHDWYEALIKRNRLYHYQDIVVFLFDTQPPASPRLDAEFHLREMQPQDMQAVHVVDHLAFEPIWRLSTDDLSFAVKKSAYCTVIEYAHEIVAYQISSMNGLYAHLGRLAVHPELQHRRLGFALLQNLLDHFMHRPNIWGVTLNTQDNNTDSIHLYQKAGFRKTGERFPVYIYPV